MNLYNATELAAGYTLGIHRSGRNCLVLAAKATYDLPTQNGAAATLAKEQIPLYETDAYTGEPGYSAPIYENDYATYKPKCDVLLNGSAYAPAGQKVSSQTVRLQVGGLDKSFHVIGPRYWQKNRLGWQITAPEPFTRQTISYDTAYGGSDPLPKQPADDEQRHTSLMTNPVGIGYYPNQNNEQRDGQALPLTEAIDQPINFTSRTDYQPQAFGAVARNWKPRYLLGGTYDDYWHEHNKPFLPQDFDELYYQCAPRDQQIDHLKGGETVTLTHLTPAGQLSFPLPERRMLMQAILSQGDRLDLTPVIDTLTLEPDQGYFTLVWRAHLNLKRNIHEVSTLVVGKPTKAWERARMMNKFYLPLHQLQATTQQMRKRLTKGQLQGEHSRPGGNLNHPNHSNRGQRS